MLNQEESALQRILQGAAVGAVAMFTLGLINAYNPVPMGVCLLVIVGVATSLVFVVALSGDKIARTARMAMAAAGVLMFAGAVVGLNEGLLRSPQPEVPGPTPAVVQAENPIHVGTTTTTYIVVGK